MRSIGWQSVINKRLLFYFIILFYIFSIVEVGDVNSNFSDQSQLKDNIINKLLQAKSYSINITYIDGRISGQSTINVDRRSYPDHFLMHWIRKVNTPKGNETRNLYVIRDWRYTNNYGEWEVDIISMDEWYKIDSLWNIAALFNNSNMTIINKTDSSILMYLKPDNEIGKFFLYLNYGGEYIDIPPQQLDKYTSNVLSSIKDITIESQIKRDNYLPIKIIIRMKIEYEHKIFPVNMSIKCDWNVSQNIPVPNESIFLGHPPIPITLLHHNKTNGTLLNRSTAIKFAMGVEEFNKFIQKYPLANITVTEQDCLPDEDCRKHPFGGFIVTAERQYHFISLVNNDEWVERCGVVISKKDKSIRHVFHYNQPKEVKPNDERTKTINKTDILEKPDTSPDSDIKNYYIILFSFIVIIFAILVFIFRQRGMKRD